MRTISLNSRGSAVEDIQRRLHLLGHELVLDGEFGPETAAAVRTFREREGLPDDTCVDEATWNALVDASFSLGDRMLYLRQPHFHGHDVRMLQNILTILGFVSVKADGIFGAHTEHALREFQASVGLPDDGIAGLSTFDAIERLRHAWEGKSAASEPEHPAQASGFARAAEALQKMEICVFGLDSRGRSIATRIANLAHATVEDARVTSADALGGVPPKSTLMVGIASPLVMEDERVPVIAYAEDAMLSKRLGTAKASALQGLMRMVVDVSGATGHEETPAERERTDQHIAVVLLDALCACY